MMTCLVLDDEPLALALLSDYIRQFPDLLLQEATSDPVHGLALASSGAVDLVFLDMQMPQLSGLQFLKVLQQRALVIVTTAYGEYALDGFDYDVVDYLLKPITLERFVLATDKARLRAKRLDQAPPNASPPVGASRGYFFVRTDHRLVKLTFEDITYMEGAGDYVVIHTHQGQLLTLESLKSLASRLPPGLFLRIHKSYLIALAKVDFIERSRVYIAGQFLPVSDSYKEAINGLTHG